MQPVEIQWFPGHMTKTLRMMEKKIALCDGVVQIVDARIPISSRNPAFDSLLRTKPVIIVLNKSDLSDRKVNDMWVSYYKEQGITPFLCDSKTGKGINGFEKLIRTVFSEKLARYENKGMSGKKLRLMVIGVPNVGKSTFINKMTGAVVCKSEDRPGVTRAGQWVSTDGLCEFFDTPGVLWHKFENKIYGEHLAYCGSVNDDIIDKEHLACRLCEFLNENYRNEFFTRYKIDSIDSIDGYDLLRLVAKKRGMLISGGELDTERAAITLLDELRGGLIGNISFEKPDEM